MKQKRCGIRTTVKSVRYEIQKRKFLLSLVMCHLTKSLSSTMPTQSQSKVIITLTVVITPVITKYPHILMPQAALVTLLNLHVVSMCLMKATVKVLYHSLFVAAHAKEILCQLGCTHPQQIVPPQSSTLLLCPQ